MFSIFPKDLILKIIWYRSAIFGIPQCTATYIWKKNIIQINEKDKQYSPVIYFSLSDVSQLRIFYLLKSGCQKELIISNWLYM